MKNIKNILKYLCKNNVKLRNRLFEQMQAVDNDRPGMTLGQFKNFIDQHVRHPQNIKVEIFEVSRNHGIMHVYCGKDQFNWQPNLPHVGFEMKDDVRYANTGKVSQLLADIQAMIGAQADVVNTPLKLVSNDDKFDPYVFFEDQSDTLILVKPENAALDTKRLVQQKIEEGFNQMSNHNGTRNLTLDEIYEAMVHAAALPQDREILKSLIPDSEKDELLRRLQNQAGNNIAAARQAAQPA